MARQDGPMRVAILVATGFEEDELREPRSLLQEAGLTSEVISPDAQQVRGWHGTDWGEAVAVDVPLECADPDAYDAVFLPGSVMNPERLRRDRRAEAFLGAFFAKGKPVAALCRGPWDLIDNAARGRTSVHAYRSIRTDVAGMVSKLRPASQEVEELEQVRDDARPGRRQRARAKAAAGAPQGRGRQLILWVNEPRSRHES